MMLNMTRKGTVDRQNHNLIGFRSIMFVILLLAAQSTWAATAGVVLASRGEVYATGHNGDTRSLATSSRIYSGDLIRTGRSAAVQLRFNDGTLLSLKENTQFRVDEYEHNAETNTLSKAFYSLLKGGFRSVTSLLSKNNKRAYRVSTAMATIGIRGTDFEVTLCEGVCPGASATGLHLEVHEGTIVVNNQAGEFEMTRGDVGFVPSLTMPLQNLPKPSEQAAADNVPVSSPAGTTLEGDTNTEDPDDDTLLDPTSGSVDADAEFQSAEALICVKK